VRNTGPRGTNAARSEQDYPSPQTQHLEQFNCLRFETTATPYAEPADTILSVNNIEVVYDHVILVLKGVSLTVPRGGIVSILGANGAGKTTTLKAISNLLGAERGDVTKGSIEFEGEEVQDLSPNDLVRRGCIQVMEGRHCFGHLTIEEKPAHRRIHAARWRGGRAGRS
jgi:ABC-type branched-subunit amino acid transport system ATPase component